jgi:hypothetical protein
MATIIREQGKNFSGGQRQRLAIARAILRDAPIVILDEPTASLDVEAEAEVMHALDKLVEGRTVLMISHRLSTLGSVDEILVLKDGRIVEQGSFQGLKRKEGVFAGLLEEQNRYNIEHAHSKSILRSAFTTSPEYHQPLQVPLPLPSQTHRAAAIPMRQVQEPPTVLPPGRPTSQPADYIPNARHQPEQRLVAAQAAPSGIARILVEIDGKVISECLLNKPMLTVGRLPGNDVQVPSQRVSRLHARIRWENSTWLIEDAESVNGLVYQGHRVERLALSDGDRVYLAPTAALRYQSMP